MQCDICGKEFKNKSGLGGHHRAVHGVKKQRKVTIDELLRTIIREEVMNAYITIRATEAQRVVGIFRPGG